MTSQVSRGDGRKLLSQSKVNDEIRRECSHMPEAHVIYDMKASGYRGQIRCRCGWVTITYPKVRERCAAAEADARAMMEKREK